MNRFEAPLKGEGFKIAIVVSRFNRLVTEQLVLGAVDELKRHGVEESNIDIYYVPGSFEIPQVTAWLLQKNKWDGIIALGAVVRGETPHFEYIATEVTRGLGQLARNSKVPITFGIITADDIEQAINRAGLKEGNKGAEAARSLLEMINLKKLL